MNVILVTFMMRLPINALTTMNVFPQTTHARVMPSASTHLEDLNVLVLMDTSLIIQPEVAKTLMNVLKGVDPSVAMDSVLTWKAVFNVLAMKASLYLPVEILVLTLMNVVSCQMLVAMGLVSTLLDLTGVVVTMDFK